MVTDPVYVVIAGGGKVGRHIAVDLLEHGHDVTIVERVAGRCEDLLREHDLLVIVGDVGDVSDLEQARTERADVFVATTGDDDTNFVACTLAQTTFDVPRVIARVNAPRNEQLFRKLRIEAVSTTTLISRLIREQLSVGDLVHLYTLKAGKVNLVEVDLPPASGDAGPRRTSSRPGQLVSDLALPRDSVLVCVFRGDEVVIPRGETRLRPGDQVIALTRPELEDDLRTALLGAGPGRAAAGRREHGAP